MHFHMHARFRIDRVHFQRGGEGYHRCMHFIFALLHCVIPTHTEYRTAKMLYVPLFANLPIYIRTSPPSPEDNGAITPYVIYGYDTGMRNTMLINFRSDDNSGPNLPPVYICNMNSSRLWLSFPDSRSIARDETFSTIKYLLSVERHNSLFAVIHSIKFNIRKIIY